MKNQVKMVPFLLILVLMLSFSCNIKDNPNNGSSQNEIPAANSINITGEFTVGLELSGNYTYSDTEGDPEGISTYKWLVYDDYTCSNGEILAGTNITYQLVPANVDKYIKFEVTPVAASGNLTGNSAESSCMGPVLPNTAPEASDVSISGTMAIFQDLTGEYTYADAEGDLEGISTFRWIMYSSFDCTTMISVAGTGLTYQLQPADNGNAIIFEVTPVALTGEPTGSPATSVCYSILF